MRAVECGRGPEQSVTEARGEVSRLRRASPRALAPVRDEAGQSVVEFAMVLPLVAALVVVLLQFGKVIYSYIDLTHLANEGARYGAVNKFPGGSTSPSAYLCPKLSDSGMTGKKVVVAFTAVSPGSPTAGDAVTVTVSESYKLIPFFSGATIPISTGASMRLEQPPTYSAGTASC